MTFGNKKKFLETNQNSTLENKYWNATYVFAANMYAYEHIDWTKKMKKTI